MIKDNWYTRSSIIISYSSAAKNAKLPVSTRDGPIMIFIRFPIFLVIENPISDFVNIN